MPEKFNRKTFAFGSGGLNLTAPVDEVSDDQYAYLLNVYSAQTGTLQTRPGYTQLSIEGNPCVALKRVNNQIPGSSTAFERFAAFQDGKIYGGTNADVLRDTGYSGNAPSLLAAAPAQSPETWLYVADSLQMRKLRLDNATAENMGIFPPTQEPTAALSRPQYKTVSDLTATSGWTAAGIAASLTTAARVPATTTILAILYDTGTTGWASVAFTNPSNNYSFLGRGGKLNYGSENAVPTEQVFATLSSTTVAAIQYDTGTTGLCTVQMATPFNDLEADQMLKFPSEYVRVLSVTTGPDGLSSFRCSTVGTIAPSNAITSVPSARVYLTATHAAGETVAINVVQTTLTLSVSTTQGTGTLTSAAALDLSQINNRPVTKDDYMHISLRVDHPELVLFGRVLLDVDAVTNDFTQNFYYQPFEHNDFTASAQGTASQTSSQQQSISLQQIRAYNLAYYYETGGLGDFTSESAFPQEENITNPYANYPISTSMQSDTGSSVWTEFLFKISDLQRVGTDDTRTLANVAAIRIELTVSGTVVLGVGSWWIEGTYGPDILDTTYGPQGFPILARYRYRNSTTGAISVQSPALRSGELPRRTSILLSGIASTDPQVDYIDWEVFGGSQESWNYAGSVPNGTAAFTYDLTNTGVLANDPLSSVCFKPFPISDTPKHSQVTVSGTAVTWVAGDLFNPNWAAGGQILIGSKAYTLYAPPASTTFLFVTENVGALTNVAMVFAEPTIMGQPLPLLWGPDQNGRYFGAGDPYNPQKVYPTNADTDGGIDGASDQTVIEMLSPPSDPVMNGVILEDTSLVLTANTIQKLQPTPGEKGISYVPIILETALGLYARNGACVYGGSLWYIGNNGIYRWNAGTGSVSITEATLGILFPHNSLPGDAVTRGNVTVFPPDFGRPNDLSLSAAAGYIFFDYPDTNGQFFCLAYRIVDTSWWLWQYADPTRTHYQEEGQSLNTTLVGTQGGLVALTTSGMGDANSSIPCAVYTKAYDAGDPRSPKVYGDGWIKANPSGAPISVAIAVDDYSFVQPLITALNGAIPSSFFLDLTDGNGSPGIGNLRRNLGILLNWTSVAPDAISQVLYFWEVGPWEIHPQIVQNWASQPTTHGMNGFQHVREIWIPYASQGAFTFKIVSDGTVYSYPFASSGGKTIKARLDTDPIKGKLFWYGTSGVPVTLYFEDIEVKVKEWGSTGPYASVKPFA